MEELDLSSVTSF